MTMTKAMTRAKHTLLIITLLCLFSCHRDKPEPYKPTPYEIETPAYFPNQKNIPDDNPMTEEGVALGKKLFYDTGFSAQPEHPMTCATCHHKDHSYENGGTPLPTHHSMLPLINLVWNKTGLGWNGGVESLEEMVYLAAISPVEINGDTTVIASYLQETDDYPEMFRKAFGNDKVTFANAQKAIAQYVRSLVSCDSKFDRYLKGEEQLTQDELNGYLLFVTEDGADCFHCHGGGGNALFTTNLFYNNGLDDSFTDTQDRFSVTGDPVDRGAYKAPTLRNITLTAPYMHDGRFSTIDEVIDFYSENVKYSENVSPLMHHVMQGGVHLTEQEKQQLKAFLNTLTDNEMGN